MALARELAASLPDEPRWVDTRGMLLSEHAEVTGDAEGGFVVRVVYGALSAVASVGRPPCPHLLAALDGTTELTPIIAQTEDIPHVAGCLGGQGASWNHESAIVHVEPDPPPRPAAAPGAAVRFLDRDDSLAHLPPGLRHEMTHARELGRVAAAFVGDRPVSFCYPVWITESLWDVSVDTLEEYRGRSLAAYAFWLMRDHMREQGRRPVWGALASNAPSLRLARRLGFVPVGEIAVFSRGGWVFMSGGFEG